MMAYNTFEGDDSSRSRDGSLPTRADASLPAGELSMPAILCPLTPKASSSRAMDAAEYARVSAIVQSIPSERRGPIPLLPYDFSDGPRYFVNNPPTPSDLLLIAELLRRMDEDRKEEALTKSSIETLGAGYSEFGGPSYDFDTNRWVIGHVIEDNGKVSARHPSDDLTGITGDQDIDPDKALKLVGQTGLAAGKLFLKSKHTGTIAPKLKPFHCSGICLEKRFFLTVVHFEEAAIEALREGNVVAKVGTTRRSEFAETTGTRTVFLVDANKAKDIAILCLEDGELDFDHSLCLINLFNATNLNYRQNLAGRRVWTVGFAGRKNEQWKVYLNGLKDEWEMEPTKKQMIEQYAVGTPNFGSIFHPNERILALGKLADHISDPALSEKVETSQRWLHSIPGWFGMSGGMVGTLAKFNEEAQIVIFGLYSGGWVNMELNHMMPFTKWHLDCIAENTGLTS